MINPDTVDVTDAFNFGSGATSRRRMCHRRGVKERVQVLSSTCKPPLLAAMALHHSDQLQMTDLCRFNADLTQGSH